MVVGSSRHSRPCTIIYWANGQCNVLYRKVTVLDCKLCDPRLALYAGSVIYDSVIRSTMELLEFITLEREKNY
ncbi:hypothetical protein QTP88_006975 [Uroleucon formosanum]